MINSAKSLNRKEKCTLCHYYDDSNDTEDWSLCRINPPNPNNEWFYRWAKVEPDDWCGKFLKMDETDKIPYDEIQDALCSKHILTDGTSIGTTITVNDMIYTIISIRTMERSDITLIELESSVIPFLITFPIWHLDKLNAYNK